MSASETVNLSRASGQYFSEPESDRPGPSAMQQLRLCHWGICRIFMLKSSTPVRQSPQQDLQRRLMYCQVKEASTDAIAPEMELPPCSTSP